ncbi:MAG: dihydrodipicolinate synthase family protein [Rhodospirillales bacterium]|mgnify:CR=1 FL=1|nr:dihydrodipicolinate synthase family protein [Rhodospirillales bacterium]
MSEAIRGAWAAATTPLDGAGGIDTTALARHARWLLDEGCDGLVLFGTSGEGPSFTLAERLAATEAVLRAGIPAAALSVGTGCPAIADTVALTKGVLSLGIARAMILPPFYFAGVSPEGIEDAYAAVFDGIGDGRLSACLYHIPQVCGVGVPAVVLGNLRRRYGALVSGVKDSSGDFETFLGFRRAAPEVGALVGAEVLIPRALAEGGAGTICGMANVVPRLVRRLFSDAAAVADMEAACAHVAGIPALKAVQAALTGNPAWRAVRPPLRFGDAAAAEQGAQVLRRLEAGATAKAA